MSLLQDILSNDLTTNERRIIVQQLYDMIIHDDYSRDLGLRRSKTPGGAKSLLEFYDLVRQVIDDMERREEKSENNRIIFTEEEPDIDSETETITFSLVKREPGAFGRGAPFEASVRNMLPIIREDTYDSENPDYRIVVLGYWYDNIVRFTCWAKTNKVANARALWFENLMQEYTWFFRINGVSRVLFWSRDADQVIDVGGNRWYGRPINYFVRTERLKQLSEKKIEELIIKIGIEQE